MISSGKSSWLEMCRNAPMLMGNQTIKRGEVQRFRASNEVIYAIDNMQAINVLSLWGLFGLALPAGGSRIWILFDLMMQFNTVPAQSMKPMYCQW